MFILLAFLFLYIFSSGQIFWCSKGFWWILGYNCCVLASTSKPFDLYIEPFITRNWSIIWFGEWQMCLHRYLSRNNHNTFLAKIYKKHFMLVNLPFQHQNNVLLVLHFHKNAIICRRLSSRRETHDMRLVAWVGEIGICIFRFMSFDHLLWLQKCAVHIGILGI